MISKRAKKFIDDDTVMMNNGDSMVDASTAYMAVEIAEEEMIEKAGGAIRTIHVRSISR